MLKRPSTWSSIWRCWAVTQTRELTSGVRARRWMTGAIFTASGRVPRIESTRSGGSGIGFAAAQDMKTETRLAPGRAIPHAAAIDGDPPGHGGSDGSRGPPAGGPGGEAGGGDAAPFQAPQGALDQAGGVRRLVVVHLTRLADQAGEIWRGLDEEPGIDADAVAGPARGRGPETSPGGAVGG